MGSNIRYFRELEVYKLAMEAAMGIFELTRRFPVEERYSLTDQARRCSRSVPANIAEAWRKRRYSNAFVSKLNDAEAEAAGTEVWLELAVAAVISTGQNQPSLYSNSSISLVNWL